MKPARITPCATLRPKAAITRTPNTAAAIAARLTELPQLGGLSSRSWRRWRAICLASSRVCGRPVRPARSIVPAGVPRCLRVRLRLVCAMDSATLPDASGHRAQDFLEQVTLWGEPPERHVVREALEGGAWGESDQLGLRHLGSRAHVF